MAGKFPKISILDLLSRYNKLDEAFLNEKCSDKHIIIMADMLGDWEKVSPSLGVNADDVKANVGNFPHLYRRKCLQMWKEQAGFRATYYALLEVLLELRLANAASNICELLIQGTFCGGMG
jgi:hypothetical protein